jgi:PAS domain S-box-containing protein
MKNEEQIPNSQDNSCTLATAFFNETYKCVYVNAKFCQLLGYTSTEFFAMDLNTLTKLVHPEDRTPWQDRSKALDNPEFIGDKERQRFIKKDGSIVLVDKSLAISRDVVGHRIVEVLTLEEV